MKSIEFFNKLIDECNEIPESKLEKIISYYQEQILNGVSNGRLENEIILGFGNINDIIYRIKNNPDTFIQTNFIDKTQKNIRKNNASQISYANTNKTNNSTNKQTASSKWINILLKLFIGILLFTIIFPLIATVLGFILGFLALFVILLFFSIFILINISNLSDFSKIPKFILTFPREPLTFFSIGSIFFSLFIIIGTFYLGHLVYLKCKNFYVCAKEKEEID